MLTGDREVDSQAIRTILAELFDLQVRDRDLFRLAQHSIREKNQNDKRRFERFQDFAGPDDTTMTLLFEHAPVWNENPSSFWSSSSVSDLNCYPDPHVHFLEMYLRAERDSA